MDWFSARFELSRDGGEGNIRPMEGLRGLAVFLVFLVHAQWFMRVWVEPHSWMGAVSYVMARVGQTGVDIFFVLSGYLIYGSLVTRRQQFLRFMVRRARRLYPTFIVVFSIYVVGKFLRGGASEIPFDSVDRVIYIVKNLLFIPGLFPETPLITAAWSLSYEVFFYISCAILVNNLNMQEWPIRRRVISLFTFLAIGCVGFAIFGGPVRLLMFLFGALLHDLRDRELFSRIPVTVAFAAFCISLFSVMVPGNHIVRTAGVLVLGFGCLLLCGVVFCNSKNWVSRILVLTPLRRLGNMSYSYYLIHSLVLTVFTAIFLKFIPAQKLPGFELAIIFLLLFAATIIGSMIRFLIVERPLSLKLHDFTKPSFPTMAA